MNDFVNGRLYFIKDEFFEFVGDKYLKLNKQNTKRPHYYAFKDSDTNLLWVIPCSSQIDKYKKIIQDKQSAGKKHNHIQIIKVNGIEQAFLYQDMFPIIEKYIEKVYIKQNTFMEIKDPKKISAIENNAKNIIKLMRHNVKFTPTQPDVIRIEELMIEQLRDTSID
jgi:3-methyladenine DNA glycosylase Tag